MQDAHGPVLVHMAAHPRDARAGTTRTVGDAHAPPIRPRADGAPTRLRADLDLGTPLEGRRTRRPARLGPAR